MPRIVRTRTTKPRRQSGRGAFFGAVVGAIVRILMCGGLLVGGCVMLLATPGARVAGDPTRATKFLEVDIVKIKQSYSHAEIHAEVINTSDEFISSYFLKLSAYDASEQYLGQTLISGHNLRPGASQSDSLHILDLHASKIHHFTVELSSAQDADRRSVGRYFAVRWKQVH